MRERVPSERAGTDAAKDGATDFPIRHGAHLSLRWRLRNGKDQLGHFSRAFEERQESPARSPSRRRSPAASRSVASRRNHGAGRSISDPLRQPMPAQPAQNPRGNKGCREKWICRSRSVRQGRKNVPGYTRRTGETDTRAPRCGPMCKGLLLCPLGSSLLHPENSLIRSGDLNNLPKGREEPCKIAANQGMRSNRFPDLEGS